MQGKAPPFALSPSKPPFALNLSKPVPPEPLEAPRSP